jgi:hypothetical protein
MNKKIALVVALILLWVAIYHFRSPVYDSIMGSDYRPILSRDVEELSKNIDLARASFSEGCNDKNHLYELIKLGESVPNFGLMYDLARTKQRVANVVRRLNAENLQCRTEEKQTIFNVSSSGLGKFARNVDLTGSKLVGEYLIIKNEGLHEIEPKITLNGLDVSSLEGVLSKILAEYMYDEEKAIAIWEFVKNMSYHFAKPVSGTDSITPISFLNSWGYSNCGDSARTVIALSRMAGFDAREVRLGGHIVAEIFYGGRWHMFDADSKNIFRGPDHNILSVEQIENDISVLLTANTEVYNHDFFRRAYSTSEQNLVIDAPVEYSPLIFTLRPGESIIYTSGGDRLYFSAVNYTQPPVFSNGYFVYEKKVSSWDVLEFDYPYPIVGGSVEGIQTDESVYFSTNKWQWIKTSGDFSELFNNGHGVPDNRYYLKFKEPGSFVITTTVQMSTLSLPLPEENYNNTFVFEDRLNSNSTLGITFGLIES